MYAFKAIYYILKKFLTYVFVRTKIVILKKKHRVRTK